MELCIRQERAIPEGGVRPGEDWAWAWKEVLGKWKALSNGGTEQAELMCRGPQEGCGAG